MPSKKFTLFVQAMLCKVDDTGVNINGINLFSKSHSETKSLPAKAMIWETIYTIEEGTNVLNGSIYGYSSNSEGELKFRILNGSTTVYEIGVTNAYNGVYENTVTFSNQAVGKGYLIQIGYKSNNNSYTRSVDFRYNVNLTGNGNIYKAYNYKGKPRSNTVKAIGNKESSTLFGVHSDNERLSDNLFTMSGALEYVKSKGEQHVNNSGSEYTAKGYGYCTYTLEYNNGSAYVKVNGITICLISTSGKNTSNIFFFKPGDIITFANSTGRTIYDYY